MEGIDALRKRRVPAPRNPRIPRKATETEVSAAPAEGSATDPQPETEAVQHVQVDDDHVTLGVRVPRDLDHKLVRLSVQLRLQGFPVTKADLVALALEDLPDESSLALVQRLALARQREAILRQTSSTSQ